MSSSDEIAPGTILAERFRLVRELGRGGMGVVYEAVHVLTGRRLAVKFLHGSVAQDAEIVTRFVREARAAASIGDPHIVEVVDLAHTPGGTVYIVLEFLDGRELSDLIASDPKIPVARAAHIVSQLAAAMGRAHARGIVHRDLKPANVFLIRNGRDPDFVKVLDFGIAKLRPSESTDGAPPDPRLTRTEQIIGTALYMPAEQLRGSRDVDARADVYAMGTILYEMLTGRVPYEAQTLPEVFLKIMTTDPVPLTQLRPDVPVDFAAIVARAMAREIDTRFADGAALADALAPWADGWRPARHEIASAPTLAPAPRSTPDALSTTAGVAAPSVRPPALVQRAPTRRVVLGLGLGLLAGTLALVTTGLARRERPAVMATRATPLLPPDAFRATPPMAMARSAPSVPSIEVRFSGATGAVTIAGVGTCVLPCTLGVPRDLAVHQATMASADGTTATHDFVADGPREISFARAAVGNPAPDHPAVEPAVRSQGARRTVRRVPVVTESPIHIEASQ